MSPLAAELVFSAGRFMSAPTVRTANAWRVRCVELAELVIAQAAEMPDCRSAEGQVGHAGQPVENTQAAEVPKCRSAVGHEGHAGHGGLPGIEEVNLEVGCPGVRDAGARARAHDRRDPDGNHGDNLIEVQR